MKQLLFLLLLTPLLTTCKKDPPPEKPTLPPRDELTCKINGKPWKAERTKDFFSMAPPAIITYYYESTGYFGVSITNSIQKPMQILSLVVIKDIRENERYSLERRATWFDPVNHLGNCENFDTDSTMRSYIFVDKIDYVKKEIHTHFEMYTKNKCNATAFIEGRLVARPFWNP